MFFIILFSLFSLTDGQLLANRANFDMYGERLASNDQVVALARNEVPRYEFHFSPFGPENFCPSEYSVSTAFVINLAMARDQNSTNVSFVYLRTYENNSYYLELGKFSVNPTVCLSISGIYRFTEYVAYVFDQKIPDISILKVDFPGYYAYGFLENLVYIFDIRQNTVTTLRWSALLPNASDFLPRDAAIGVTKNGTEVIILVGYFQVNYDAALPAVYLLGVQPPNRMIALDNFTLVNDLTVGGTFAFTYNFDYVMSISIAKNSQQALIALPYYSRTILLEFNDTNVWLSKTFSCAARSVGWFDNGTQAALLLSDTPTPPWASSQVQVIDTAVNNDDLAVLYAIPNNQQTINFVSARQTIQFIRLTISNGRPVILTGSGLLILVPIASAGYFIPLTEISSFPPTPQFCPDGTFKITAAPSPCMICPHGFRKRKNTIITSNTNLECVPCSSSSFCPLAAVDEVNLLLYPSLSQAFPYPDSPASTSFDDVVLTHSFIIRFDNQHCLLVSPLFWTSLVLALVLLILIIMTILYWIPRGKTHYKWLTKIFRHTDLIGEGELWIGGLTSFAVIALISFGIWFGVAYHQQYPIESAGPSTFHCDLSIRNAKFTSSLQLLALIKSDDEQVMFNLLDQQNWTLTLDFIQTGFLCHQISVQSNIDSYRISLPISKCTLRADNATRSVIVPLPSHTLDLQVNLTGNAYIGAIRICLHGPSTSDAETYSTVRELTFCQLLSTSDQTVSQVMNVQADLTKVINKTEGLEDSDPTIYSGIWIPTLAVKSYNDRIAYSQQGTFLRYLAAQQVLLIYLKETQFFIKNSQEPIARGGEIIFHVILFSTVCIELFALTFLLFKLAILPCLDGARNRIKRRFHRFDEIEITKL